MIRQLHKENRHRPTTILLILKEMVSSFLVFRAFFATPLRSLRQSQPILTSGAADAGPANQHLGFDECADRAEIGFVLSHFMTLLLILKDLLALFLKLFAHNSRVRLAASAFSRS